MSPVVLLIKFVMDAQRFLNFVECHAGCCYLFDPKQALQFKENELLGLIRLNRIVGYWKYQIMCDMSKPIIIGSVLDFVLISMRTPSKQFRLCDFCVNVIFSWNQSRYTKLGVKS